jgi:uncharacterized membrane protein YfcA
MLDAADFLWMVAAGCVAGTLNVLAGGGSFITLPVLIFFGLPPGIANGTNRVAILLQNMAAVWSFRRYGVLDLRALGWAALPATVGSALGTWAALRISDADFQRLLAFLMLAISLWTLWQGRSREKPSQRPMPKGLRFAGILLGFFLVGIYGGFVQAGVGFLVLAMTRAAGLDLVRGNAVKVLAILCLTGLALGVFAWQGKVRWVPGLALGVGTILGALIGARLSVLKGHVWLQRVVSATIVLFALKLWLSA